MCLKVFKNLRLQKKIFLICLLVSLLPVIILGSFCYKQVKTFLFERERSTLQGTLIQHINKLNLSINECENVMKYIISDENMKKMLNQTYNTRYDRYIAYRYNLLPYLSSIKYLNSNIKDIIIYTDVSIYPQGSVFRPLSDVEDSSWYEEACRSYKTLSVVSQKEESFLMVQRYWNMPKDDTALIAIEIDYDSFFSFLSLLYEENYGILLTDENDTVIYEYQISEKLNARIDNSEKLQEAFLDDYIVETAEVLYNNWKLYLYYPTNRIYESVQIIMQMVILMIFFCLFCVILLSFFLSNLIVRPLQMLAADMKKIERGNFEVTVAYDSADEIGDLVKSFRIMSKQIDYLINETMKAQIIKQEDEMRILQAQINPHFLYNALSMINSRAILIGQRDISQMAQFLADFYRTTLNKGKNITTVEDELNNIHAYVNILLLMHSHSFDITFDINDEILSCEMLHFLLQPLVENAILHGIDHREQPGRGLLVIEALRSGDTLIFRISDNGPGIPKEKLSVMLTALSDGYGVSNVHKRVRFYYGSFYGLSYHSELGIGTTVTLTIPVIP